MDDVGLGVAGLDVLVVREEALGPEGIASGEVELALHFASFGGIDDFVPGEFGVEFGAGYYVSDRGGAMGRRVELAGVSEVLHGTDGGGHVWMVSGCGGVVLGGVGVVEEGCVNRGLPEGEGGVSEGSDGWGVVGGLVQRELYSVGVGFRNEPFGRGQKIRFKAMVVVGAGRFRNESGEGLNDLRGRRRNPDGKGYGPDQNPACQATERCS